MHDNLHIITLMRYRMTRQNENWPPGITHHTDEILFTECVEMGTMLQLCCIIRFTTVGRFVPFMADERGAKTKRMFSTWRWRWPILGFALHFVIYTGDSQSPLPSSKTKTGRKRGGKRRIKRPRSTCPLNSNTIMNCKFNLLQPISIMFGVIDPCDKNFSLVHGFFSVEKEPKASLPSTTVQ